MSEEDSQLITVGQIVEMFGVSRKTVQRWISADPPKIVPAQTLPGKTGAHLFTVGAAKEAFGAHKALKEAKANEK